MKALLTTCPSCAGPLHVGRIGCPACSLSIEGDFSFPSLLRLSPSQLDFVEVFIKNRGIIRDVERELGVSYPTVRARLDEVIQSLGFQPTHSEPARGQAPGEKGRQAILGELKAGRISPEQALRALRDRSRGASANRETEDE